MKRNLLFLIVALAVASVASASTTPPLRVLGLRSARSDFQPRDTKPPALRAGVTYAATMFPIPLRVTPPDGSWAGGQGKSVEFKTRNPGVGWVELVPVPSE